MKKIQIHSKNWTISNTDPITLIAGPCVIEGLDHALYMADRISKICTDLSINWIYKSSFDKANRTSLTGYRGVGMEEGLQILETVKNSFGCPIVTDVHLPDQCQGVAEVADILQIPAFLCRQTDLLHAASATNCIINIKKGQFLAPWDMVHVIKKIEDMNNFNILLCERGASFGYNTLVSDMRSLSIMANTGYPVIFDATHSVQQPGGLGQSSGGERKFAPILARAAVAVGVAGVFLETHDNPNSAPSDGPNMIPIDDLARVLLELRELDTISKQFPRF